VDAVDRRILTALQAHPDLAISDVAEIVGLSTTPCWRRLKRLERDGVILGKAILLDAKALGLTVNVFAEIRLKQHDEATLMALEEFVRNRPEIVECFSVSGDADYLMRILVGSIEAYEVFLKQVLLHLPGVAAVNSRFALGCVKLTNTLPIPKSVSTLI
jgi:Lrp/AsnC family transcriptional regulator